MRTLQPSCAEMRGEAALRAGLAVKEAALKVAGVTEQGQGTEAILRQIVAEAVGVPIADVRVITMCSAETVCRSVHTR
jgi:CO/xanthine dehydrogenase Mo-binding subunit